MRTAAIVIPARFASSRFPGKPLAMLKGKPLIQWTWEVAMQAARMSVDQVEVHVATDDDRIASCARGFGANVILTSPDCANGTERVYEAVTLAVPGKDVIVNLQGDSPLSSPDWITQLIDAVRGSVEVATPIVRMPSSEIDRMRAQRRLALPAGETTVVTSGSRALYFSKEVLPPNGYRVFVHVGMYAYTPLALRAYAMADQTPLELSEGLEQLRFLENGVPVHCVEFPMRPHHEVNNPSDLVLVAELL